METTETPKEIIVYSTTWCPDCKRAKRFLGEQRVPYTNIDIEQDPEAMARVEAINGGMRSIPTIVFPDGDILIEPSNAQLAEKLGLQSKAQRSFYDAVVVGAGPTGLTAALYLAREGLDALVIERAGLGGQAGATQRIDNFPGFDEGVGGVEFGERLAHQARRFGVEILQTQQVSDVSPDGPYLCVTTSGGAVFQTKAVLLASGARYRKLGVPGEDELLGLNVHFCATCDGAFSKGKEVLVIGGGNSGFQEGLMLTKFARKVDIVELGPEVQASAFLQEQVAKRPEMSVIVNHAVKGFRGRDRLEAVVAEDRATGEVKEWHYDGVFVFIGLTPNNDLALGKARVDPMGFVITDERLMTTLPGLFAAGDVRAGSTKQAASAAGEGATAALMIRDYLRRVA
jgi:thioredoxin reductase (NADPH)